MLKKTHLAVGIVVALGVVWSGGAWYTGKQIENNLDEGIALLNQQIKQNLPDSGLQLSKVNYHRGWFSSKGQLALKNSGSESFAFIAPGQQLLFNEQISHGPFPLHQLKSFNLVPAAASLHSELINNDTTQTLFKQNDGRSPMSADTRLNYGKTSSTRFTLLPLNLRGEKGFVLAQQGNYQLDADHNLDRLHIAGETPEFEFGYKNALGENVVLTFKNVKLVSDSHLSPEKLRVGLQQSNIGSLSYQIDGKSIFTLNQLDLTTNLTSENNRLSSHINYDAKDVSWHQQSLGHLSVKAMTQGFNATKLKTFIDNYNSLVQQRITQLAEGDKSQANEAAQAEAQQLIATLPDLLDGAPKIHIDNLSLVNQQGESKFSLIADFNDPSQQTTSANSLGDSLDSYLKNLHANLQINKAMAQNFIHAIGQAQGYSATDSAQLAEKQIAGLAAMGEMFHLTTSDEHNINAELNFAQGKVQFNNQTMSVEQFLQRYLPVVMQPGPATTP